MSTTQTPLSTSAPCLPSILSTENTTSSDDESPNSNSHSRGNSDGSDQIILPTTGLRLPSPAESTQSHSSYREEELEGEIKRLRKELETKFKENTKLMLDRKDMDNEINELTESLFVEANKMVNEAKRKERNAVKRLEEALLRIECLQDEAQTFKKKIVDLEKYCTNSPILNNSGKQTPTKGKKKLNWLSRTSTSHLKLEKSVEPQDSSPTEQLTVLTYTTQHYMKSTDCSQRVSQWMEAPSLLASCPLISEINSLDVKPSLSFSNEELSDEIQGAIHSNTFMMEKVVSKGPTDSIENSQCDLTYETDQPCHYKIKIAENSAWYYINARARQRIAIVCEFFQYLRYIKDGLIKPDVSTASFTIQKLRANMTLSRLGLTELSTATNNAELLSSV